MDYCKFCEQETDTPCEVNGEYACINCYADYIDWDYEQNREDMEDDTNTSE